MKTLPDNPSLGHLRRQAKDLLTALRDYWPGASLADAQASLAQEYGFRTWPQLKAEVDRLRGKADLADEGLARAIAERYGLGDVTGAMRSLTRPDDSGRQWSLNTTRGRGAVRSLDIWIPIVDADADAALQLAATNEGIALPAPVRSRHGAIVESIGGHDWRVHRWLHSGPPLSAPVSATTTGVVGEILAKIHRLGLPVDRISPWHASRLSQRAWPELAATAKSRGAPWAPALAEVVPILTDLESIGAERPQPAPVLCHNNLIPGNVRLGQNNQVIVFGWDHAGGQPPARELCEALTHWAVGPNGSVNAAGARAMIDGYRRACEFPPPLDITTFRGTAIGLANYVAGEIDRALKTDNEEDQRHADRSVQHLLAHLPPASLSKNSSARRWQGAWPQPRSPVSDSPNALVSHDTRSQQSLTCATVRIGIDIRTGGLADRALPRGT